jgi:polyisoprenoid-binding protein YceI
MPRRRLLLTALLLLLLGGAGGAVGVWYFFFNGEPPAAASIDQAAGSVASGDPAGSPASLDGTWTVDTSIGSFADFSNSWAGFRVNEVLDNIGDATAIGRTPVVGGSLTLTGQTLSAANIEVDLTTITSDRPRRDPAIQQTLETGSYPTATFGLTEPVELPSAPADGVTYTLTATGDLTIHGITRAADFALEARLVNGVLVVVGSTPFTFSDYGMSPPRAPIVLSVADHGTIELQLFFTKS